MDSFTRLPFFCEFWGQSCELLTSYHINPTTVLEKSHGESLPLSYPPYYCTVQASKPACEFGPNWTGVPHSKFITKYSRQSWFGNYYYRQKLTLRQGNCKAFILLLDASVFNGIECSIPRLNTHVSDTWPGKTEIGDFWNKNAPYSNSNILFTYLINF